MEIETLCGVIDGFASHRTDNIERVLNFMIVRGQCGLDVDHDAVVKLPKKAVSV